MDKEQIDRLLKKYDLKKDEDVLALYGRLQNGEFDLTSPEGRAFDDQVYELAMAAKKRRLTQALEAAGERQEGGGSVNSNHGKRKKSAKKAGVVVYTKGEMRAKRFVMIVLFLIMAGCLGYFVYYIADASRAAKLREQIAHKKDNVSVREMFKDKTFQKEDETAANVPAVVLDEYKSLYNQNKNLIGWLQIADTNIDYPVMQTADNTFYLDHDINQKEDKNGTLFLDASCDVLKPSMNLIIYGHNMRSGNMFGSLDKYKSEDFYRKHPLIRFDSIYETGTYEVMYVFNSKIYDQSEIAFKYYQFIDASSAEEYDSNMRQMAEMSLYDTGITAEYGDRLLTLSTCDYLENDSRFVVVAKRTD